MRGNLRWTIDRAHVCVEDKFRNSLIHKSIKGTPQENSNYVTFSTSYSKEYNKIVDIIKKYLPILHQDDIFSSILSQGCNFIAKKSHQIISKQN